LYLVKLLRSLNRRERVLLGLCGVLIAALAFGSRDIAEVSAKENTDSGLFRELKTFTDVLAIVRRDYVSPVDNKRMVEGAIKGLLATLDPHSGYLDPDFYQDLQVQTKGEFGGLGIEITIRDGLLVVVAPMEGSPAERAGVRNGDTIVKIEGRFTKEFSLVDAVKRLRGPKGTPITISISRKGATNLTEITIVRDNIAVKSVRSRYLGDGLGYVRISQFMEHTTDDLRAALAALTKESGQDQLRGLVLDLRNNPGGLLTQAVSVGDLFLKEGVIVYTDGRIESQKQKFFAHARGTEPDYPMVVLVNGGSASASEIVAGALKDYGRALILGTQTFGKGSVQTITPLENGGALTLTTALYFTKSGNSIQAMGVRPDIELEPDPPPAVAEEGRERSAALGLVRERDLPGAIQNPSGSVGDDDVLRKINKTPEVNPEVVANSPEKEELKVWLARDSQMQRAVELLKSFSVFQSAKVDPPPAVADQQS
jgi:carboxyl-terminal processing protease